MRLRIPDLSPEVHWPQGPVSKWSKWFYTTLKSFVRNVLSLLLRAREAVACASLVAILTRRRAQVCFPNSVSIVQGPEPRWHTCWERALPRPAHPGSPVEHIFYHEYSLTDIRMVMWILLKIEGALGMEGWVVIQRVTEWWSSSVNVAGAGV